MTIEKKIYIVLWIFFLAYGIYFFIDEEIKDTNGSTIEELKGGD